MRGQIGQVPANDEDRRYGRARRRRPEEERLLTEEQVSQTLRVSTRTLQAWRVSGDGPAFLKIGRQIRYRRQDVREYIEDSVRLSTSDPGPNA